MLPFEERSIWLRSCCWRRTGKRWEMQQCWCGFRRNNKSMCLQHLCQINGVFEKCSMATAAIMVGWRDHNISEKVRLNCARNPFYFMCKKMGISLPCAHYQNKLSREKEKGQRGDLSGKITRFALGRRHWRRAHSAIEGNTRSFADANYRPRMIPPSTQKLIDFIYSGKKIVKAWQKIASHHKLFWFLNLSHNPCMHTTAACFCF